MTVARWAVVLVCVVAIALAFSVVPRWLIGFALIMLAVIGGFWMLQEIARNK